MIHIVGAGPGAVDLITVRGQKLLSEADVVIYAGSLVSVIFWAGPGRMQGFMTVPPWTWSRLWK